MKYYYREIGVRTSEYEFTCNGTVSLGKDDVTIDEYLENLAQSFYDDEAEDEFDNGEYYAYGGEICSYVNTYKEITKEEYEVLRNFIN
jgi:hypothetical protein